MPGVRLRQVPNSDLGVSLVGLGCNNLGGRLDAESSIVLVRHALDRGITLFDTADIYPLGKPGASEELLGRALGERRKDAVVATKFGKPMDPEKTQRGASRRYVIAAVEASLKRLRTDWIDLLQVHEPDPATPIEETLRALDDLIRQGKVRHIACSNFPAWRVVEAQWTARHHGLHGFVLCQDEYSLVNRALDRELVPVLEQYGLGLLPFFPLAGGLLTGKYGGNTVPKGSRFDKAPVFRDLCLTDEKLRLVAELQAFCARRGKSLVELAFSWLAQRPFVSSVIAGASTPGQIDQNVHAVEWELSASDMAEIDRLTLPRELARH
jgi:aryl-alcohol dehydrogenase-like predicted oxidoreductase